METALPIVSCPRDLKSCLGSNRYGIQDARARPQGVLRIGGSVREFMAYRRFRDQYRFDIDAI